MNHQERLFNQYYSKHYSSLIPKTTEEWEWVINRIEFNFGEFFNKIPIDSLMLDVACGVGYMEYYLLKNVLEESMALIFQRNKLRLLKQNFTSMGLIFVGKVEFYLSDIFEHLIRENGYTGIAMIDFLEHLEKDNILNVLDLSYSALLPGGFLFVRVINADNPMWGRFFIMIIPTRHLLHRMLYSNV